jgi:hypothetical protein
VLEFFLPRFFFNSSRLIIFGIRFGCDIEPFLYHYCREELVDPSLRFMLDELQKMELRLGDKIEGRCIRLQRRMAESEQCAEECLISLEMTRSESE